MPVEIRVPALGESVVEATVGRWVKKPGDQVAVGDVVVELETDKVNVEVHAEQAGVLESVAKQEGENVAIGDVLATLNEAAVPSPEVTAARAPAAVAHAEPASVNGPAHASPVARKLAEEKDLDLSQVKGTGPGGRITKQDVEGYLQQPETVTPPALTPQPTLTPQPALTPQPPLSPSDQWRDREIFPRTGEGEISAGPRTVERALPSLPKLPPLPSEGERREERVRMSRRRQTIAARLVEAQHNAAMLTTFNEADMTAIIDIRKRRKESFKERHGVNLGFMSFFTKAIVAALKQFPMLNAEIQGDEVLLKHYYDIGIAVSTDEGLVVPVVRDAERKSFAEIERDIAELALRARDGKLTLPELQGGTFTITNGGVFGSLMATPILNAPQVGILGMHKIQERPVAVDGQVVIRPMMYLALSYDHRIVDGKESVSFLVRVKELIEDPAVLLVDG